MAKVSRAQLGDRRRLGDLTFAIRRLETLWRRKPRQAGSILIYWIRGDVTDPSGIAKADVLIAYDTWSGAIFTSVQLAANKAQTIAAFLHFVVHAFPPRYRPFLSNAYVMPSRELVCIHKLASGSKSEIFDSKEDLEFEIDGKELTPISIGILTHNGSGDLVSLRHELLEWERLHNCETSPDALTRTRGGNSSPTEATAARNSVSDISVDLASTKPKLMARLIDATEPFTPARRLEIALYMPEGSAEEEEPLKLSDISRFLNRSKKLNGTRLAWNASSRALTQKIVGRLLTYARESYGETQIEAARKMGISQQHISRLESDPASASRTKVGEYLSIYGADFDDMSHLISLDAQTAESILAILEYLDDL